MPQAVQRQWIAEAAGAAKKAKMMRNSDSQLALLGKSRRGTQFKPCFDKVSLQTMLQASPIRWVPSPFADNLRQLLPLLLREWPVDEDSEVHRDGAGTEMALARLFYSNSAPRPRPSSAPVLLQVRAISAASERDEVSLLGFDFQSPSQWEPC